MQLVLNGRAVESIAIDLHRLLHEQGLQPETQGVAVAVNGEIVPRAQWPGYELKNGDVVEVITAMQGG
jgi:sulfur carrier protein